MNLPSCSFRARARRRSTWSKSTSKSKRQPGQLFCRAAGNDHARWPQQAVLEPITATRLADDRSFRKLLARFVRDRFMQIRIEFLGNRVDRLQSIFSQAIIELLENQTHA